ncbi:spore germination protein [Robertmurraya andreesenii]|uniref:Spore germination protein n=1 Tax=Anoxybacillus andreesenii TaxID=1325932 RepID=A0ABT9VAI7_9BACL|nr:spore germination protein [Robertmurraya andreesenii]MDQ0157962.1 hypothetical protein [Robertmurraya andreesenii]
MQRPYKLKKILKNVQNKSNEQKSDRYDQLNPFSTKLDENERNLKEQLGNSPDIVYRRFPIHFQNGDLRQVLITFIDGLVLEMTVRESVLKPLVDEPFSKNEQEPLIQIQEKLSAKKVTEESEFTKAVQEVLKGKLLLLIEGFSTGLIVHIEAFEFLRAVQEPESEKAVRGARDGFIESSAVNISLLRRRISHPSLQFDTIKIGKISQTAIVIAYIKGLADEELVSRARKRLGQIKVDGIHGSGDIEQFIEDHPYSIFSTIGNTERPDTAAALLLDGRILILTDGDPVCLYIPLFFSRQLEND